MKTKLHDHDELTKRVKLAMFVFNTLTSEYTLDVDVVYCSSKSTYSDLLFIARKYYSKCNNIIVLDVCAVDGVRISYRF